MRFRKGHNAPGPLFINAEGKHYVATFAPDSGKFLGYYVNAELASPENRYDNKVIYQNKVSEGFKQKLLEISNELGIDPNKLMAVIAQETAETFKPDIRAEGQKNGAVGLIQFTQTAVDFINEVIRFPKSSASCE